MICHARCKDGKACGYKPKHRGPHKPEKICRDCGGGMHPDTKEKLCAPCRSLIKRSGT